MQSQERSHITTITLAHAAPVDVIYGRGNHIKMHPGNIHYRLLVDALREYYVAFPKNKKKLVSKLIYETIRGQNPPGKFISECEVGKYVELDMKDAIRKINQCFREKQQVIKEAVSFKKKMSSEELDEKMQEMRVSPVFSSIRGVYDSRLQVSCI